MSMWAGGRRAAAAGGKWTLNVGQTCLTADYVLVVAEVEVRAGGRRAQGGGRPALVDGRVLHECAVVVL